MEKENFFKILCRSTPEELNKFISLNGSQKMVNAVTFTKPNEEVKKDGNNNCPKNEASN